MARLSAGSDNTFVMARSPRKLSQQPHNEPYLPRIITAVGEKPACLVNASVTYTGNNVIYLFGGFDESTDDGMSAAFSPDCRLIQASLQPCSQIQCAGAKVESS